MDFLPIWLGNFTNSQTKAFAEHIELTAGWVPSEFPHKIRLAPLRFGLSRRCSTNRARNLRPHPHETKVASRHGSTDKIEIRRCSTRQRLRFQLSWSSALLPGLWRVTNTTATDMVGISRAAQTASIRSTTRTFLEVPERPMATPYCRARGIVLRTTAVKRPRYHASARGPRGSPRGFSPLKVDRGRMVDNRPHRLLRARAGSDPPRRRPVHIRLMGDRGLSRRHLSGPTFALRWTFRDGGDPLHQRLGRQPRAHGSRTRSRPTSWPTCAKRTAAIFAKAASDDSA